MGDCLALGFDFLDVEWPPCAPKAVMIIASQPCGNAFTESRRMIIRFEVIGRPRCCRNSQCQESIGAKATSETTGPVRLEWVQFQSEDSGLTIGTPLQIACQYHHFRVLVCLKVTHGSVPSCARGSFGKGTVASHAMTLDPCPESVMLWVDASTLQHLIEGNIPCTSNSFQFVSAPQWNGSWE